MKKLIFSATVPESIATFCKDILENLSHRFEVVAMSSPGESLHDVDALENVRTIKVNMERRIAVFHDIVSLWKIIHVFRKEKPYIVHSITPKAGLLCMIAAWITRVPVRIHTFTGLVFPTEKGLKRRILMITDSITCFCATHIIPEGEGIRHDLLSYGITRKDIKVLGYGNVRGVNMDYYRRKKEVRIAAKNLIKRGYFTYLFVGRIVRDKGIDELCAAFNNLHKNYPKTRLVLVGNYEDKLDPISPETKVLIENNEAIEAVGAKFDNELLAYYTMADCFILPSYREGFPNTVLEAGAMGLPSIVTDINGSREIIIEGENGMIIPPADADALQHAMENLLLDDATRNYMASNARQMIEEKFEQGFVHQCLMNFYEEIVPHQ